MPHSSIRTLHDMNAHPALHQLPDRHAQLRRQLREEGAVPLECPFAPGVGLWLLLRLRLRRTLTLLSAAGSPGPREGGWLVIFKHDKHELEPQS